MTDAPLLLAIDQGTTSSRAMVFKPDGTIVTVAQEEFPQIYPQNGWVEHDPEAIWQSVLKVTQKAIRDAEAKGGKVVTIGITNQRETTVVWDRETGKPVYNAIVWQDRRTANICTQMKEDGTEEMVQNLTGLLLDPYFSATKISWILDNVDGARLKAERGKLAFGTIDSFLLWRLTGGASHATDATNASRTSLYDIEEGTWSEALLSLFNVPREILPTVKDSAADFGETDEALFGRSIPIQGIAGDQQAAAFGQCCFEPGDMKSTYGTGCFVLVQTGQKRLQSKNRLLTTIAYQLDGKRSFALEGSIFMAGAAVQWLRDGLQIIDHASETEEIARSLESTGGVYMVPAFTGLGAPHWAPDARGAIYGMTRDTGRAEIIRATVESVAYQTHDLITALKEDGVQPGILRVDGGMIQNDWLCEFLAGLLRLKVVRPKVMETTALGAAALAGLQAGIYSSLEDVTSIWQEDASFQDDMPTATRTELLTDWRKAVARTLS